MLCVSVCSVRKFLLAKNTCFDKSEKSGEPLSTANMPQKAGGKPNAFDFVLNLNMSVQCMQGCIEACLQGQQVHCVPSEDYS